MSVSVFNKISYRHKKLGPTKIFTKKTASKRQNNNMENGKI
jgi:hypothetical protein|tara:strand:+ start:276 stop:398 length:123 start_codon:yes stop_codon:yes gene_type:complete